jgi:hypothetical protein
MIVTLNDAQKKIILKSGLYMLVFQSTYNKNYNEGVLGSIRFDWMTEDYRSSGQHGTIESLKSEIVAVADKSKYVGTLKHILIKALDNQSDIEFKIEEINDVIWTLEEYKGLLHVSLLLSNMHRQEGQCNILNFERLENKADLNLYMVANRLACIDMEMLNNRDNQAYWEEEYNRPDSLIEYLKKLLPKDYIGESPYKEIL